MNRRISWLKIAPLTALVVILAGSTPFASDLWPKSCEELMRIADNCQQDIKTVDIVLGSAIDAGSLDRVKMFKIRKEALKKQLDDILNVIGSKDCLRRK
jgi:hypothetical protein